MSVTTNMSLTLPTVSVTLGPQWANEVNAALETIDSHDHSSGKGVKIKPSGMNINAALDFLNNRAINLSGSRYQSLSATQTGSSNTNLVYSVSGNLYFTNGSGTAIQITSGGSLVSSPGAVTSFQRQAVSSNLTISPASNVVFFNVDTTASRTITLPLASAVSDGRIYIFKDEDGSSNSFPITIDTAGSDTIDGSSSATIDSNYGSITVIGDGSSAWYIA